MPELTGHRRYALVRNEYTLPAETSGATVSEVLARLCDDAGVGRTVANTPIRVQVDGDKIRFFTEHVSEGPWPT